ncbi:MAG: FitA-like ribbon-helix-helix domain-containing protein [Thermodesulfobacteriota bacterium]
MKAVTIRGVDPEVAEKLKYAAAEQGKSINQLTLDIIREGLGLKKNKKYTRKYNDLDALFGKWNDEEFQEIQGKIDHDRKLDPELWR